MEKFHFFSNFNKIITRMWKKAIFFAEEFEIPIHFYLRYAYYSTNFLKYQLLVMVLSKYILYFF